MRIVRVFPRRTNATPVDGMAFAGEPPLPPFLPKADGVHISVTFTWDLKRAAALRDSWARYYPVVRMGGPALGDSGNGFLPGQYLRPGYTITSRGCPNHCPWCLVPAREGGIRELPIMAGWNVLDNNILACSDHHLDAVFRMLDGQRHPIEFTGGLEAERVTPAVIERLRGIRLGQAFLAYDMESRWPATLRAIEAMRDAGLRLRQVRCFILCGRDGDTIEAATDRCERVLAAGALPFAMLWQGPDEYRDYPKGWRRFQRSWTRPAAMLATRLCR
jgi:hypothetical protein